MALEQRETQTPGIIHEERRAKKMPRVPVVGKTREEVRGPLGLLYERHVGRGYKTVFRFFMTLTGRNYLRGTRGPTVLLTILLALLTLPLTWLVLRSTGLAPLMFRRTIEGRSRD